MSQTAAPPSSAGPSFRYLRPQDLRSLRHQTFSPRHRVEGRYAGRHTTRQRGHTVEFNDYREYLPGDPVTDIDWKVYGRSDRLFIKQFEHQTEMTVNLLVDASASMDYAGSENRVMGGRSWLGAVRSAGRKIRDRSLTREMDRPSKYDQACFVAAAIAFLTVQQQDRVALGLAQDGLAGFEPAGGSFRHLHKVVGRLERQPHGRADMPSAIEAFARRTGRRGVMILLSDLMEDQADIARALSRLTHRGTEVIVFHVMHPDELKLPDLGEAVFVDSESGQKVRVNVNDIRNHYGLQVRERLDRWAQLFRGRGIDYRRVTTDTPYRVALERYLAHRDARA